MINASQHKQLFLDDYAIERMEGVRRTLHSPEDSRPVLPPDRTRGEQETTGRNPPQWNPEKGVWEWYYWTGFQVPPMGEHKNTHKRDANQIPYDAAAGGAPSWSPDGSRATAQRVGTYATSLDGIHWERSVLGLYEYRGSRENNIAWLPGGDRQTHVIRDTGEEDPSRRYKAFFGANGRQPAASADGFEWTMLDVPRIPGQDTSHLFWDPYDHRWAATIKHRTEWGRSVWLVTSDDFDHWTEAELILESDEIDWANKDQRIRKVVDDPAYLSPPLVDDVSRSAEVYWMAVLPYEGLYVGFPMLFNPAAAIPPPDKNYTGLNQTELAVSRDLNNWERVADRSLFLEVEPRDGKNYGTALRSVCGHPVIRDNEIWVYQNAGRFRGPDYLYEFLPDEVVHERGALCLGKLRLDGFVSLDSESGSGTVVTRPMAASGDRLHVNVNASTGRLDAQVLDSESMEPLDGLSGTVKGDHLDEVVVTGLTSEKPVRVRFTLSNASLYAFWTG